MARYESLDVPVPPLNLTLRQMFERGMWAELMAIIEADEWRPTWSDTGTINTRYLEALYELPTLDDELDYVDNHD